MSITGSCYSRVFEARILTDGQTDIVRSAGFILGMFPGGLLSSLRILKTSHAESSGNMRKFFNLYLTV